MTSPDTQLMTWHRGIWSLVALAVLAIAYGIVCYRMTLDRVIPGEPVLSKELGLNGMADYRDAAYWPGKAFMAGSNPYNTPEYMQQFPTGNNFPLFSPLLMVVYGALSLLPFNEAASIYAGINTLLFGGLVAYSLWVTRGEVTSVSFGFLGAFLFLSQPGRACFHGGQLAAFLTLLAVISLSCSKSHPRLSGIALALCSIKPTFGIPLGIVLLAQRRWTPLLLGWGLGFAIGVAGLVLIFSQREGLSAMPRILLENQAYLNADPDVDPRTTHVRIDSELLFLRLIPTFIGHSSAMLLPLGMTTITALLLLAPQKNTASLSQGSAPQLGLAEVFGLVTIGLSMYHLIYDALVLFPALCAIAWSPVVTTEISRTRRYLVLGLLSIPFVNILWSPTVVNALAQLQWTTLESWTMRQGWAWEIISLLNPVAVLLAWLVLGISLAQKIPQKSSMASN